MDAAQQQEGREVGEKMEALVLEVIEIPITMKHPEVTLLPKPL